MPKNTEVSRDVALTHFSRRSVCRRCVVYNATRRKWRQTGHSRFRVESRRASHMRCPRGCRAPNFPRRERNVAFVELNESVAKRSRTHTPSTSSHHPYRTSRSTTKSLFFTNVANECVLSQARPFFFRTPSRATHSETYVFQVFDAYASEATPRNRQRVKSTENREGVCTSHMFQKRTKEHSLHIFFRSIWDRKKTKYIHNSEHSYWKP